MNILNFHPIDYVERISFPELSKESNDKVNEFSKSIQKLVRDKNFKIELYKHKDRKKI